VAFFAPKAENTKTVVPAQISIDNYSDAEALICNLVCRAM
jgi:hypothetical protein